MRIQKISYNSNLNSAVNFGQSGRYSSKNNTVTEPVQTDKNIISCKMQYPHYYNQVPCKDAKCSEINNDYFKLPKGCKPDNFQIEAAKSLSRGNDLIADAPTGTGKTAIAHYAISKNMQEGKKTFYTTPLKALSNQKYNEFKSIYGEENVGILTGDRRENQTAPILIMTTEVYRNMALANMYGEASDLMENLKTVIFDEFHYIDDNNRGSVWEEAKMFTPKDVQIAALSATFGNPDELIGWFNNKGEKTANLVRLPSCRRSVPLKYESIETNLYTTAKKQKQKNYKKETAKESNYVFSKPSLNDFKDMVDNLKKKEQLPAIFFVFSKKFSRDLLEYLGEDGQDLTTVQEKEEIETIISKYENEKYIGSDLDIQALKKGYAIHNAGIIPAQKELIEELFQKKLIKTVIATETLAAGINMPAKTVVISSPYKPDDITEENYGMRLLTPNEFKQMSGRAGRRGIDTVGYVYTMPSDKISEKDFKYLETEESSSLTSKYNPGYDFLAGYYKYFPDNDKLADIFNKTFYAYDTVSSAKTSKIQSLMDISSKKTSVLLERRILEADKEGKINPTVMSDMASKVRGYDVLTIIETIADKKTFKNISPQALAMIMGAAANPANPNEEEITGEVDIQQIFDIAEDSADNLTNRLNSSVNSILKKIGQSPEKFGNYEEMLSYAQNIENIETPPEYLKSELNKQKDRRAKMYTINKTSGNYSLKETVMALKDGKTVPSKVLGEYSDMLEKYKNRIHCRNIDDYIEKLILQIQEQDYSKKGNKAKSRQEKKLSELSHELENAKMMKYLDENLITAIDENYQFLKKNPQLQVKEDFNRAEELYYKSISKDILINKLKALIKIQENTEKGNISIEDTIKDYKKTSEGLNNLKNKSDEIRSTEKKHGIDSKPEKYNKIAAQIAYIWSYLNRINPEDTMSNWEYLLRIIPKDKADEGSIYRIIMQTADILSQIAEVSETGYNNSEKEEDKSYYLDLKETAKEARNLMIKEPIEI